MSVSAPGEVRDDSGRHVWLGPLSVCLGLVSLVIPILGSPIAGAAILFGAIAILRRRGRKSDVMAIAGISAGSAQLAMSIFLLLAETGGG